MAYATIIAMLALIEYFYFGIQVGGARARTGVKAPAVAGNEEFERFFRAHQNTLEQLVIFLPALYASAYYVHPLFAVAGGVAFLDAVGSLGWELVPLADSYTVYRGSLTRLRLTGEYTQDPLAEPLAEQFCQLSLASLPLHNRKLLLI